MNGETGIIFMVTGIRAECGNRHVDCEWKEESFIATLKVPRISRGQGGGIMKFVLATREYPLQFNQKKSLCNFAVA
jgi:hypothetical protein